MQIFLTRLKTLLRRKDTIFWILLFPILLASAECLAFGSFISSTPMETISLGVISEEDKKLEDFYTIVLKEAELEENKALFDIVSYEDYDKAKAGLQDEEIEMLLYKKEKEIKLEALKSSMEIAITSMVINQASQALNVVLEAQQNGKEIDISLVLKNLLSEVSYVKDESTTKNATFYTVYFYSLIAMACLYGALFGVNIIWDIRADRSALGIRISSSVVSKTKLLGIYFLTAALLEFISSCILFVYLRYILNVSLGNHIGLILLTMTLGGIAGLSFGMLVGALVKGSYNKCQGIITAVTLTICALSGLMSVDVKHLIDKNIPFINQINPAALITNSLYSLYYYDTFSQYIGYTCGLVGFSVIALGIVMIKTRGEKYASL